MKACAWFLLLLMPQLLLGQGHSKLQSGPMLGYVEMREVMLWVQTTEAAEIKFEYSPKKDANEKYYTASMMTSKSDAFVAKLVADEVQPGVEYTYSLLIDGEKVELDYPTEFQARPLWQWREDPPAFSVALGSCYYVNEPQYDRPGKPYGGDYYIFERIHDKRPDVMLWLGDNTYLREADWNTRTGIYHRHTHTRSVEELQPLLASTAHYAIWDDHDFGPNDSDYSFPYKNLTEEAFNLFWANPNTNVTGMGGITGTFQWADCDFYLLDNRYHRTPNGENQPFKQMWGREQLNWMLDHMESSRAPFKFVATGGQVLHPAPVYENVANYAEERAYLLAEIDRRDIDGVIFLTGDRHHTELTMLERRGNYPLYDLTVSPLTSGTHAPQDEGNYLQVEGTLINDKNYGLMSISGERRNRVLKIQIFNNQNELQWEKTINAADLRE